MLALLTPVAKACLTELGLESASLAIQCLGGHGFIAEWGLEQNYRDARISTLYEGTTGIQAIDLLGRQISAPSSCENSFTRKLLQTSWWVYDTVSI